MTDNERCIQLLEDNIRLRKRANHQSDLLEALKRILATDTMTTAVHAIDESYEIATRAIEKAEKGI